MNLRLIATVATVFFYLAAYPCAAMITPNISGVKAGPVQVTSSSSSLKVVWVDGGSRSWEADFSLDESKPLITSISVDGRLVVDRATPVYRCTTGRRKGGWDAFFDAPAQDREGSRTFVQNFHPKTVVARSLGDRVEVSFDGMQMGVFKGSLRYTFYPGSALIQQTAVLSTNEPDVAYFYDAGLKMSIEEDRRPGFNMESDVEYYDPQGMLQKVKPVYGSERHTLQVKYRAVSARTGAGSIAVLPSPHRYIFARDYSTNMGFAFYSSWRGQVSLGVQQPPEDNTTIYPWMNAPPGTDQEMGVFLLLGADTPASVLKSALAYTHSDSFPHLPGYVTFAPHWHFAFTEQEMAKGPEWEPPFVGALKQLGVDAALIFEFHGDGHANALTEVRLQELKEMYAACKAKSKNDFLLIPGEEADVILGGHWGLAFPKPVFWFMDRKPGEPLRSADSKYGAVYRVRSAADVWQMVTNENGFVYQTHPRTKGSTGYPDKILATDYFRDSRYFGTGWKAMPSDLSSPRLGERGFKTLDDLNNLGLHKRMIGEVDVFQIDTTDELYAHMNINYVRLPSLPDFDHYGSLLKAAAKGEGFISTGEVTLPTVSFDTSGGDLIKVSAQVSSTFPLRIAEVVWGDGVETHHHLIDLQSAHEFDDHLYSWQLTAPHWTWARLAVWDVAADGAFTNPIWREGKQSAVSATQARGGGSGIVAR